MKKYYANLLGNWTDITNDTVEDHQDASLYFRENWGNDSHNYNYINVQHDNKNYRIHTSMIQIVTE